MEDNNKQMSVTTIRQAVDTIKTAILQSQARTSRFHERIGYRLE
jgi:hypothetical protein